MNGITHKQAMKWIDRRQDGLLKEKQKLLLEEHLRSCDSCRSYSEEMDLLASRLNQGLQARWEDDSGPSKNVMNQVMTNVRSISAAKRTSHLQLLTGVIVLVVLAFTMNFMISKLQSTSTLSNAGTPTSAVPANLRIDPQSCKSPESNSVPSQLYGYDVIQNTAFTDGNFTYDFWLYCDPALKPDDPEHFSAIAGLGIYSSWRYTGPQVDGPVRYYYAFDPAEPFGESGSDGPLYQASAKGKLGIDLSETRIRDSIQQGVPIQFRVVVESSLGQDGAILSFDLQPAEQGYKIANLQAEKLNDSNNGLIAFMSEQSGNRDIYTMRTDGSRLTNITNDPANDYGSLWSPDGQKILFQSERTGNRDIFIMDADGSHVTQLTDNPGTDNLDAWSPDGTKIIYETAGKDINEDAQFVVMDADGNHKTVLTEPGSYLFLGWSPDSRKIVYLKQNTETDNPQDDLVVVMNTDGTDRHEWNFIVDRIKWVDDQHFIGDGWNGQVESPDWAWVLHRFSTDGDPPVKIASHSSRIVEILKDTHIVAGGSILAWYTSDGSPAPFTSWDSSEVCRGTGDQFIPANWTSTAPDESKALIVIPCQSGKTWFYINPLYGSPIRKLTDFSMDGNAGGGPVWNWSPDGKYGIMTISGPDGGQGADFYLFDIDQMLKDATVQPVRLTMDEAMKGGVVWQPVP